MWIVVATIANLLATDAALFFSHYAMHKVPILWQFHKTHHSAQVLTPFTVNRVHPIDMVLTSVTGVALSSIAGAACVFAFDVNPTVTVLGVNVFQFAFYLLGYHLRHSHIWVMFPAWVGRHISSPALHLSHRNADPRHYDRNMAQIFTFWDRLLETLYLPQSKEDITFGIGHGEDDDFRTLGDMYFRGFRAKAKNL